MVKQWPFNMIGTGTLHSAVAFDSDGQKYMVDLVPLYKGLTDLHSDRATKTDDADFWEDFVKHTKITDIHTANFWPVKKALGIHWRRLTGRIFPPHGSNPKFLPVPMNVDQNGLDTSVSRV
jgi:hypothetical protein